MSKNLHNLILGEKNVRQKESNFFSKFESQKIAVIYK